MSLNILFIFSNKKDEKDFIPELNNVDNTYSHVLDSSNKDNFNLNTADYIMYDLFSIYNSRNFYSHYHNIIERKIGNKFRLFTRYFFWKLFKKSPRTFEVLYKNYLDFNLIILPSILKRINKFYLKKYISIISDKSTVVFCSTLSSTEEFNFLRASIIKKKKNGICTRNWDNPSSKTFIYPKYFSFVMSWSNQMDNHYRLLFENHSLKIYRYLTPRFNYIKNKESGKNLESSEEKIYLLYAGSQKMIKHEVKLLSYISKKIRLINKNIMIIYRPHPWNYLESNQLKDLINDNINLTLDPSISSFMKEANNHRVAPIFHQSVSNSLSTIVDKSRIIISPAGTLSLEAGLLSKPVIVDLTNSKQSTLKLHIYMDHFNPYVMEDWVYPCFSFDQIIKSIFSIFGRKNNFEYKNCKQYADLENSLDLSEILKSII